MRKTVCILLALVLSFCGSVSAFCYVEGDFDETKYHLTGNMRDDIAGIAMTQIGYHEGNSRRDKDGLNENGSNNFIKYSEYSGFDAAWCAMFIVWCARKVGIGEDSGILDSTTCASVGKDGASFDVQLYHYGEYTPRVGDLVFFDSKIKREKWKGAYSNTGHVGLIVKTDESKIYTVEGNSDDRVSLKKYDRDSSSILGYGVPSYETDFSVSSLVNFPGIYMMIQNKKTPKLYPNKQKSVAKLAEIEEKSLIFVSECDGKWGKTVWQGKQGYVDLNEAALMMPDYNGIVLNAVKSASIAVRVSQALIA